MKRYNPNEIEQKWQEKWEQDKTFKVDIQKASKPFFNLMMFPYPSGEGLHVGHVYAFGGADTFGRFKKMSGFDVFEPMGFDAFGIHSENYAIKVKKHPKKLISETTTYFREEQLKKLGALFDWDHEVITSDPDYYKWTQWLVIQLFKAGLAVRKKAPVDWCPSCKTVLADEQVVAGKCERCGHEVIQKELEQWFFKITDYAQKLLDNLEKIDWSQTTKTMQKNWIGRSDDTEIDFLLKNEDKTVKVLTTRPDTVFGATFVILAPEHPLITNLKSKIKNFEEVEYYKQKTQKKTDFERGSLSKEKTGVKLEGIIAVNPVNNREIPVYVSDFVLITYGTGAIMGVPAHDNRDFEFAKKYGLSIENVIERPKKANVLLAYIDDQDNSSVANKLRSLGEPAEYVTPTVRTYLIKVENKGQAVNVLKEGKIGSEKDYSLITNGSDFNLDVESSSLSFVSVYMGDGRHINSDFIDGMYKKEAITRMNKWLEERRLGGSTVHFRLRDWLISRQRYWGPPIPMIFCEKCKSERKSWFTTKESRENERIDNRISIKLRSNQKPDDVRWWSGWYPVPEKDLPVELPHLDDYQPKGRGVSPLATLPEFMRVKCPECGTLAKRETDVSDTFLDSSWYYLRYPSVGIQNSKLKIKNVREVELPWSIGVTKKWLPVDNYIGGNEHAVMHLLYARFITMALKDMGLIDFEEPFRKFRAHGLVIHEGAKMSKSRGNVVNPNEFIDSYGADTLRMYLLFLGPYDQGGAFSDKAISGVYRFLNRVWFITHEAKDEESSDKELEKNLHRLIKSVGEDFENLKFNTAIASFMEFLNLMYERKDKVSKNILRKYLLLLAPFAPHISEELWSVLKGEFSIHQQKWPEYDPKQIEEDRVTIVIQVNGRLRDKIEVDKGISEEEVARLSLDRPKIKSYTKDRKLLKSIWIKDRLLNLVIGD